MLSERDCQVNKLEITDKCTNRDTPHIKHLKIEETHYEAVLNTVVDDITDLKGCIFRLSEQIQKLRELNIVYKTLIEEN